MNSMRFILKIFKCCVKRKIILLVVQCLLCFLLLHSQIYLDFSENSFFRKVTLVKNSWFERQYVGSWIQQKLLALKWESYVKQYCLEGKSLAMAKSYTHNDYLQYVQKIGPIINFEDGHTIFDNGCGCGAFLAAFNQSYKNVQVGGLDLSPSAIRFAKEIFPDRKDAFKVGTVENLAFVQDNSYDHAMTFFTFPYVSPKHQCEAVHEMLRIVKPGGSLYIGHNLESDCSKNHIGIYTLPRCFWSEHCLNGHKEIEKIYYIKERELFGEVKYCPEKSAVFVYKKGGRKELRAEHSGMYQCNTI